MEALVFFTKGIAAGFVVAAPIGPVAMLCIKRTLSQGLLSGYSTGMGATVADTAYAIIAVYSIGFISDFLFEYSFPINMLGGIILLFFGISTIVKTRDRTLKTNSSFFVGDFLSGLLITTTNPMTMVAFGVVFSTFFGTASVDNYHWRDPLIIAGVSVGAALWWGSLASAAMIFKKYFESNELRLLNRFSGLLLIICGFGILLATLNDNISMVDNTASNAVSQTSLLRSHSAVI